MDAQILLNANSKTIMDHSLCNYLEILDILLNKNMKKLIKNVLIKVQFFLILVKLFLTK
jgi:hypothetical protein